MNKTIYNFRIFRKRSKITLLYHFAEIKDFFNYIFFKKYESF